MKILDKYILITYMKTFFSVFIILMFIFVLQTIWLYISELAGKDLDFWIVMKFLWFVSPRLIPLVLPLTILVTSLMVFGSFSENYEFAAMKSTGISLQRAMRSLMFFILGLSAVAFLFVNNVIPYSEYKWQNLRRNIAQLSPSMVIAEGQFSEIGEGGESINIKVTEKYGDREEFLRDVIIHEKNPVKPGGNYIVTIAESGELASEEGSNTLSLILCNGYRYEEIQEKDIKKQRRMPFVKTYFNEYTINIDLTALNNTDIDKENDLSNQNMFKMNELFVEIDSLSQSYSKDIQSFNNITYYRSGISKIIDNKVIGKPLPDTITNFLDVFKPKSQFDIVKRALNDAKGTVQSIDAKKTEFKIKTKRLNKFEMSLHDKYVLPIACVILFFIGAPLGAIIRKGGMGLPMVVAILLFLTYHFIGIFAKNSAEDGTLHPFTASLMSTLIMLPLSVWLTYRATTDQGIFDMDTFFQRIARLFGKKTTDAAIVDGENALLLTQQEKALVLSRNDEQLKNIVKTGEGTNNSKEVVQAARQELEKKGYDLENL
ncbi:LptF/LptG family permease [Patiriisocius sp. Uisw_017]